jgi:bifunctional non-homologous end joining protein LigD
MRSHAIAQTLERDDPKHVLSLMRKDLRRGKIFVDWSQNDDHKTTVCAYSLRARERPTVSTPITWEEAESAARNRNEKMLTFEADAVLDRIDKLGDLFAPILRLRQKLPM